MVFSTIIEYETKAKVNLLFRTLEPPRELDSFGIDRYGTVVKLGKTSVILKNK